MRLGIFARTFARPTIEEVFDAVSAHDLPEVQFNFACAGLPSLPAELELGALERIGGAAAARNVSIAAISGTFNMIHPDLSQRTDGLQRLRVIISACVHLGANVVTLCTGTRDPEDLWRWHPENHSPEAWCDLIASLEEALEVAELHGVQLGFEPEINNVIDSARRARQLLDELRSPNLKIILDAANLFHPDDLPKMKEILEEAFELLGGDIVMAHAKELGRDGHAGNLAIGAGVLDWGRYVALLRQAKFSGPFIMHGFDEPDAAASAGFLRLKLLESRS
ncbi:MAG: sugar phosphate isomerase/epimerase [Verrucomicrobia bacterium]|nr:sugar phosphate isomerase/epimerase [Verrucomicrobiota bacterium]